MTKENKKLIKKINSKLSQRQVNRLITLSIILVIVASILGISSSIFFHKTTDGYSELSLLMYDSFSETYVADNYPEQIYSDSNVSIYFIVKNYENVVKYYQLQIKIVELTQNVSSLQPIATSSSFILYENNTFEKIISPATNAEKKETESFDGDFLWGPTEIILFINSEVVSGIVSPNFLKIVFELWEYNTETSEFQYTGIFNFLELDYWVF